MEGGAEVRKERGGSCWTSERPAAQRGLWHGPLEPQAALKECMQRVAVSRLAQQKNDSGWCGRDSGPGARKAGWALEALLQEPRPQWVPGREGEGTIEGREENQHGLRADAGRKEKHLHSGEAPGGGKGLPEVRHQEEQRVGRRSWHIQLWTHSKPCGSQETATGSVECRRKKSGQEGDGQDLCPWDGR